MAKLLKVGALKKDGPMEISILMVGEAEAFCRTVVNLLDANGYRADWILARDEVADIGDQSEVDVCFLDLISCGDAAYKIAEKIRKNRPRICILMGIDESDRDARLKAFAAGADNFICAPYDLAEVLACVKSLGRWVN